VKYKHPDYATNLGNLAWLLQHEGDIEGAERLLSEAYEIRRQTLRDDHPETVQNLERLKDLRRGAKESSAAMPAPAPVPTARATVEPERAPVPPDVVSDDETPPDVAAEPTALDDRPSLGLRSIRSVVPFAHVMAARTASLGEAGPGAAFLSERHDTIEGFDGLDGKEDAEGSAPVSTQPEDENAREDAPSMPTKPRRSRKKQASPPVTEPVDEPRCLDLATEAIFGDHGTVADRADAGRDLASEPETPTSVEGAGALQPDSAELPHAVDPVVTAPDRSETQMQPALAGQEPATEVSDEIAHAPSASISRRRPVPE
jgi:Tetratricopeptide repeat